MKKSTRTLLLAVWVTASMVIAVPGLSNAVPITVEFEFEVTRVSNFDAAVGEYGIGRFMYETDQPDQRPEYAHTGYYDATDLTMTLQGTDLGGPPLLSFSDDVFRLMIVDEEVWTTETPIWTLEPDRWELQTNELVGPDDSYYLYFSFSWLCDILDDDTLPDAVPDADFYPYSMMTGGILRDRISRDELLRFEIVGIESSPAPVPEPSTTLLLGSGLIGLVAFRRKVRK